MTLGTGRSITDEFSADQAVGTSGKRTHVYRVSLTAGADLATLVLRNGTGVGDPAKRTIKAAANTTETVDLDGAMFDKGCFADFTGGTSPLATVVFEQVA